VEKVLSSNQLKIKKANEEVDRLDETLNNLESDMDDFNIGFFFFFL
jgi:hypothetical protein